MRTKISLGILGASLVTLVVGACGPTSVAASPVASAITVAATSSRVVIADGSFHTSFHLELGPPAAP